MPYSFLNDLWDIVRLRFKTPADYAYTLPLVFALLLLLGMINAVNTAPLLGNSTAAIVLSVLIVSARWLVLSKTMGVLAARNGASNPSLYGFTLASEALMIPALLGFYLPFLAPLLSFWLLWAFWVQIAGLMKMGQMSIWTVFKGYLLYFFFSLIISVVLLTVFIFTGLLDMQTLQSNLDAFRNSMMLSK